MSAWGWVVLGVAVVIVVVLAVLLAAANRRTSALRRQFGPEYERTVAATGHKRDAEAFAKQFGICHEYVITSEFDNRLVRVSFRINPFFSNPSIFASSAEKKRLSSCSPARTIGPWAGS